MQTGSCLVPVISFGENNIFQVSRPKEKSFMATVQKYVQLHPALNLQFCSTSYALSECALLQRHGIHHARPCDNFSPHALCQACQR